MRNRTLAKSLGSLLLAWSAQSVAAGAPPSTFPKAPTGGAGSGFTLDVLAPYRHLLAPADLQTYLELSTLLHAHPAFETLTNIASIFLNEELEERALAAKFARTNGLLDMAPLTNNLTPLLGLTAGADGSLLRIPRLRSGTFGSPLQTGTPSTPTDAWVYAHPERACTVSLSQQLMVDIAGPGDLESLHASSGMAPEQLDALLSVAASPDPVGLALAEEGALPGDPAGRDFMGEDGLSSMGDDPMGEFLPDGRSNSLLERVRSKVIPLATYLNELARLPAFAEAKSVPSQVRQALMKLSPHMATLRKDCEAKHGTFKEVHALRRDEMVLFSCEDGRGRRLGATLSLHGPGVLPLRLSLYINAHTSTGLAWTIDRVAELSQLTAMRGDESLGPELSWSLSGKPMALNFALSTSARQLAYDIYEWHDNGAPKLLGHRVGGEPRGDDAAWYADGTPAALATYAKDGSIAAYQAWFTNGKLAEAFEMKTKGRAVRRLWHTNGQPAAEVQLSEGHPEGAANLWYENGIKGVSANYVDGALDGAVSWWFEDGKPLFSGRFARGEAEGSAKLYRPGGVLLSERPFKRGLPDGVWVAFDTAGVRLREIPFARGQREGRAIVRYASGETLLEMPYRHGQLDGTLHAYFPKGLKATSCSYEQGELTQFTRWLPTGEVVVEGRAEDASAGVASFRVLRKSGKPILDCRTAGFEISDCRVLGADGEALILPSKATLFASVKGHANLRWKPDTCGGEAEKWSFEDLIDHQGDRIGVTFETLDACPETTLGETLACTLRFDGKAVTPDHCELKRFAGDGDSSGVAH